MGDLGPLNWLLGHPLTTSIYWPIARQIWDERLQSGLPTFGSQQITDIQPIPAMLAGSEARSIPMWSLLHVYRGYGSRRGCMDSRTMGWEGGVDWDVYMSHVYLDWGDRNQVLSYSALYSLVLPVWLYNFYNRLCCLLELKSMRPKPRVELVTPFVCPNPTCATTELAGPLARPLQKKG